MSAWEGVSFLAHCFQVEARKHLLEMMTGDFCCFFQLRFFFPFYPDYSVLYLVFSNYNLYSEFPHKELSSLENYQLNILEGFQTLSVELKLPLNMI